MGQLTDKGYIKDRLETIVQRFNDGFKSIYGNDINIEPDSPDGQMIGIFSQTIADFEELCINFYKSLDPNYATGVWLEQCADYAALTRKRASYSYIRNAVLTGSPNALIPAGTIVSDSTKTKWVLMSPITLDINGSGRGDYRSSEIGAFNPAEQQLKIETLVLGLATVSIVEPVEVGEDEESDATLRSRFLLTRARPAKNNADATDAAIKELSGVIESTYLENYTHEMDSDGVPDHTLNFIVDGGNEQEIAKVIFDNKTGGTGLMGQVLVEVLDDKGRKRKVWFDRPTIVYCSLQITVVRNEEYTNLDVEGIKQSIVNYGFKIGEDVLLSRLFTPINTISGFWVKEIKIAEKGNVLGTQNIIIDARSRARFLAEDIEVMVDEL